MSRSQPDAFFAPLILWYRRPQTENIGDVCQCIHSILQLCFERKVDPMTHKPVEEDEIVVMRRFASNYLMQLTPTGRKLVCEISGKLYNLLTVLLEPPCDAFGRPSSKLPGERVAEIAETLFDSTASPRFHRRPSKDDMPDADLSCHLEQLGGSSYRKLQMFFDQVCNLVEPGVPIVEDSHFHGHQQLQLQAAIEEAVIPRVIENTVKERTIFTEYQIVYEFMRFIVAHRNAIAHSNFLTVLGNYEQSLTQATRETSCYAELLKNKALLSQWIEHNLLAKIEVVLQDYSYIAECLAYIEEVYAVNQFEDARVRDYLTELKLSLVEANRRQKLHCSADVSNTSYSELMPDDIKAILFQVIAVEIEQSKLIQKLYGEPTVAEVMLEAKAPESKIVEQQRQHHLLTVTRHSNDMNQQQPHLPPAPPQRLKPFIKLKQTLSKLGRDLKQRWQALSGTWKAMTVLGMLGGTVLILVLGVFVPPSLALTLPAAVKIAAIAAGTVIVAGSAGVLVKKLVDTPVEWIEAPISLHSLEQGLQQQPERSLLQETTKDSITDAMLLQGLLNPLMQSVRQSRISLLVQEGDFAQKLPVNDDQLSQWRHRRSSSEGGASRYGRGSPRLMRSAASQDELTAEVTTLKRAASEPGQINLMRVLN